MGSLQAQLEAILSVPIGAAIIACALGFFGLVAGILKFALEAGAQRRAHMRDLAARMPGRADE
jgi:hypothetical protein